MLRLLLGIGVCGTVWSTTLCAQEFTWTELKTVARQPVSATQLKISGRETPSVPKEISKLDEIAYGEVDFVTDEKGKGMARRPRATSPWIMDAMGEALMGAHISPVHGRETEAQSIWSRCYLIFNPASSNQRKPNSTPRAIQVQSATYSSKVLGRFRKEKISEDSLPGVAYADVSVDEKGGVRVLAVPAIKIAPELEDAVKSAAQQWRFQPARRDGVPVAAAVRIPVLLTLPDLFNISELSKMPRVVRQTTPIYPLSERRDGFNGTVVVQFVVTTQGLVRDAFVVQTNNPNFNEPALDAVRQWKFEPGLRNGFPVNTQMVVPMVFTLNGTLGADRYEVSHRRPHNLPEGLKNDYPPRVINVVPGVYPFEQLEKGAHATVSEKFAVSPEGRVTFYDTPDQKLTDFDYAARAMLEEFEFVPASKNGKPNWGLLKMDVKFSSSSEDVPVSSSARHILRELKKKDPQIYQANRVDSKLERVVTPPAPYPSNLLSEGKEGNALIEFFVDEKGQALLPRVISATHPSFGYAAAQAVSQWRFKPVTHEGKPCIVRVRVPVKFAPVAASSDEKKAATPST